MSATVAWNKQLNGTLRSHSVDVVSDRIVCSGLLESGRIVWAFETSGELVWSRPYKASEHYGVFTCKSRVYLDGRSVICLDAADGKVTAIRDFILPLTQQPPSAVGPCFWVGENFDSLVGTIGLEPETLATTWEWRDANCIVRQTWLRASLDGETFRFAHLPDLAECVIPKSRLPAATGRQVMFSPGTEAWCAFGDESAAAINLPSGEILWQRQETTPGCHRIIKSTDTHAFAGVNDLSAYHLGSGELMWRQPMPGRLEPVCAVSSRFVFAVTGKRRVQRVDVMSGEICDHFDSPEEIVALVAISDDVMIVGMQERLMAVDFGS